MSQPKNKSYKLTSLALATTGLLLAGRRDRSSVIAFAILRRGSGAGSLLVGRDLVQQAADTGSGACNTAESRHGGELLNVDLGEWMSSVR